jgi:putative redox protein
LAWNRTALALIAGGLVVSQLLKVSSGGAALTVALALIAFGAPRRTPASRADGAGRSRPVAPGQGRRPMPNEKIAYVSSATVRLRAVRNIFEITLRGLGGQVVEATGGTGGRVVMGPKGTPESFTPVELLLAAIAGCSGIDLSAVAEPAGVEVEGFELQVRGVKPLGVNRLSHITVTYVVPEAEPDAAQALVGEVSELCTVALTVAEGCPVEHALAAPDPGG